MKDHCLMLLSVQESNENIRYRRNILWWFPPPKTVFHLTRTIIDTVHYLVDDHDERWPLVISEAISLSIHWWSCRSVIEFLYLFSLTFLYLIFLASNHMTHMPSTIMGLRVCRIIFSVFNSRWYLLIKLYRFYITLYLIVLSNDDLADL